MTRIEWYEELWKNFHIVQSFAPSFIDRYLPSEEYMAITYSEDLDIFIPRFSYPGENNPRIVAIARTYDAIFKGGPWIVLRTFEDFREENLS